MNTKQRFSDEGTAPERGVDGLLDELGRYRAGDDIAFLGELERKLDGVDQVTAESRKNGKRSWWMNVGRVAAVLAMVGVAIYATRDRFGISAGGYFNSDQSNSALINMTPHQPESGELQPAENAAAVPMFAKASRPVSEIWAPPLVTATSLPTDEDGSPPSPVTTKAKSEQDSSYQAATTDFVDAVDAMDGWGEGLAETKEFRKLPGIKRVAPPSATQRQQVETTAVTAAREEMLAAMEKFEIVDLGAGMPAWAEVGDTTETGSKKIVMASRMTTLQAEQEIATIKTHIDTLTGLSGDRLIDEAVAINGKDSTIGLLYQERQKLRQQFEMLTRNGNDLGVREPKPFSVQAQLDEVNRSLERAAASVKASLQTRLQIAEASLRSLDADESFRDSMDERKAYTSYIEARRKYEQALAAAVSVRSKASQLRYPALVDNPFRTPAKDPLSTFSIDVDTASYSNVRRMIQSGEAVPPDAVRIEEMINYFHYDYAAPGDELPFSVNLESAACPWTPEHRLVRVGLKGREIRADKRQALNLVFLVDVSGSMNQERKLPLVQRSLHLLIDELRDDDRITIVTYAGHEGVALAPTSGANKAAMHSAVDRLQSSGGTNGEAGIKLAYRLASENFSDGGVNRILLATDGDFNIGVSSTTALRDMVQQEAKRGVFLSVLGFGSDNLNDAMLETITNDGNGTYHYIDSVSEGRRVLVEDLTSTMITIAKDVKIQVEFNPATVGAYRLVGYANRKLPPEAFNDDRVDAGDIGAGHTVTAFYEIIPPGLAVPEVDNLKYQVPVPVTQEPRAVTTTGSPELFTVKLRYKAPRGTVSELIQVPFTDNARPSETASSDFRFAASVAAFGLQLRQSPFRGNLSRDQVIAMVRASMGSDPRRVEFAELVANAIVQRGN
ncbi:MAG: VWA domain-containing protein [Verrucomicrobiae bacterium]|nr:VWA domain-containing protein [Verrucomicrobiae bacterium]